jgi:hypothetical protein
MIKHINIAIGLDIKIAETGVFSGSFSDPGNLEKEFSGHIKNEQSHGSAAKISDIDPVIPDKHFICETYQTITVGFQRQIPYVTRF